MLINQNLVPAYNTNSKVGKQYKKCASDKICQEVSIIDRVVECAICKKVRYV